MLREFLVLLTLCSVACQEVSVSISNTDPEVSILSPGDGQQFGEGNDMTLVAFAHDPETDFADLDLRFSTENGELVGAETRSGDEISLFIESGLSVGEHALTAKVTDATGASASDTVSVSVVVNPAPSIVFTSPAPDTEIAFSFPVEVAIETMDDNEVSLDLLSLTWSGSADSTSAPTAPDSFGAGSFVLTGLAIGNHTLGVTVRDSGGRNASAAVSIDIVNGDLDGDGYIDVALGGEDCDDEDDTAWEGATELCDDVDNDCDGDVDEGLTFADYYLDDDDDGYGTSVSVNDCKQPAGYAILDGDCNDADDDIHPAADDVCDTVDNNCDGSFDEGGFCPCDVETYDNHPYMFCPDTVNWDDARDACYTAGYHMVSVDDALENAWIDTVVDTHTSGEWWIGFNDVATEGDFVWEDGSTVTYTNWHTDEPNNLNNEDCVELNYWVNSSWNDKDCGELRSYVCEGN
jgi:hypothetical protein